MAGTGAAPARAAQPQQTHRGQVGAGCSSRAELRCSSVQAGKSPVCPVSYARQSRNFFFFVAISKTQPAPAALAAAFEPRLPALAPSLVVAGDSPAAKLVASLISCDRNMSALPVPAMEHPDVWHSERDYGKCTRCSRCLAAAVPFAQMALFPKTNQTNKRNKIRRKMRRCETRPLLLQPI